MDLEQVYSNYEKIAQNGMKLACALVEGNQNSVLSANDSELLLLVQLLLKSLKLTCPSISTAFDRFINGLVSHLLREKSPLPDRLFCGLCDVGITNKAKWELHLENEGHTERLSGNVTSIECEICSLTLVGKDYFISNCRESINHLIFHSALGHSFWPSGQNSISPGPQRFVALTIKTSKPDTMQTQNSFNSLLEWIEANKSKEKIFICEICSTKEMNSKMLQDHFTHTDIHTRDSNSQLALAALKCDVCNKGFVCQMEKIAKHFSTKLHVQGLEKLKKCAEKSALVHFIKLENAIISSTSCTPESLKSLCKFLTLEVKGIGGNLTTDFFDDICLKFNAGSKEEYQYYCQYCSKNRLYTNCAFRQHLNSEGHQLKLGESYFFICPFCKFFIALSGMSYVHAHVTEFHTEKSSPNQSATQTAITATDEKLIKFQDALLIMKNLTVYHLTKQAIMNSTNIWHCNNSKPEGLGKMKTKGDMKKFPMWLNFLSIGEAVLPSHGDIWFVCDFCNVKVEEVYAFTSHFTCFAHFSKVSSGTPIGVYCYCCKTFILAPKSNLMSSVQSHLRHGLHHRLSARKPTKEPLQVVSGCSENIPKTAKEPQDSIPQSCAEFKVFHLYSESLNDLPKNWTITKYPSREVDHESLLNFILSESKGCSIYLCDPCQRIYFTAYRLVEHYFSQFHARLQVTFAFACHTCNSFSVVLNKKKVIEHSTSDEHVEAVKSLKLQVPKNFDSIKSSKNTTNVTQRKDIPAAPTHVFYIRSNDFKVDMVVAPNFTSGGINMEMYSWICKYFRLDDPLVSCWSCNLPDLRMETFLKHKETRNHFIKEKDHHQSVFVCPLCNQVEFCSDHHTNFVHHTSDSRHLAMMIPKYIPKGGPYKRFLDLVAAAAEEEEKETPPVLKPLPKSGSTTSLLSFETVVRSAKETAKETKVVQKMMKSDLLSLIGTQYPNTSVHFLGSREVGIGSKNSPVDIFVDADNFYTGFHINSHKAVASEVLNSLMVPSSLFKISFCPNLQDSTVIPRAKCKYLSTETDCHIYFGDGFPVEMSKLIGIYKDLDLRVYSCLVSMRQWAQQTQLKLPGYCLDWLVLFYLMQPTCKLLPPVKLLKDMYKGQRNMLRGFDFSFETDLNKIRLHHNPQEKCKMSTQELLTSFYEYYSIISFKNIVLCVLMGQVVPRGAFQSPNSLPEGYKRSADYSMILNPSQPVVCLDPFSLSSNLFQSLHREELLLFQSACQKLQSDSDN